MIGHARARAASQARGRARCPCAATFPLSHDNMQENRTT
jgi:hypothetical protein